MAEMKTLHNKHSIDIPIGAIGATVRLGDKWKGYRGQTVQICECKRVSTGVEEHKIVGCGRITQEWYGEFQNIPSRFVENEHYAPARTLNGLTNSMINAYGERFTVLSNVTALMYELKSADAMNINIDIGICCPSCRVACYPSQEELINAKVDHDGSVWIHWSCFKCGAELPVLYIDKKYLDLEMEKKKEKV